MPVLADRPRTAARPGGSVTGPQRDRFDDVPEDLVRVGAHRAPVARTRGFVVLAWAALATGLLVGAGVLGLGAIEDRISGSETTLSASASASAAPAATIDPAAQVVIYNGTTTTGLAGSASARAKADGWTVQSTENASSQTVKTSAVYYAKDGQEGAARGLAKSLGIGRTAKTQQFAAAGTSRLTVVLGADYAAAG